jgi:RND family efflux transporter MFP subunit
VWSDLRPVLDEELSRLPERLRRPIVLCHLEGKSNEEAARELGCRLGTIYSRLSRGRELLRRRLLHRGVTLSVAVLTAALTEHVAEATPAIPVVQTAVRAARTFAGLSSGGPISPRATALAEGVLQTMFVTKLKMAALVLFVVGLLSAGGVLTHALTAAPQSEAKVRAPQPEEARKPDAKPIAVRVVKPTPGGPAQSTQQTAEVVAAQQQQIVPLISGTVKEVNVDIGDRVKKGQVLMELDAPLAVKELEQATAAVEMAQAQVVEAEAQVQIAKVEVEAAKEILAAYRVNRPAIGAAKLAAATTDVEVKKAKIAQVTAALNAAKANVMSSRIAVDKARIRAEFMRITAAFDGVISQRDCSPGAYVQAGERGDRQPLLTLTRMDRVRVVVQLPRMYATLTERGDPVELKMGKLIYKLGQPVIEPLSPDSGDPLTGQKIARFSPVLDREKHTMRAEIDVDNPKMRLLPGMSLMATVYFNKTRSAKSFTVPASCLVVRKGEVLVEKDKAVLYVVRDGKAHRTPVKVVFPVPEDRVEIVEGVSASDQIVTNPKDLKGDVMPVEVKKAP